MSDAPFTVFVCGRGRDAVRCRCGRWAETRCAFPLKGAKQGKTCDVPLCARCQQGGLCAPHRRRVDMAYTEPEPKR